MKTLLLSALIAGATCAAFAQQPNNNQAAGGRRGAAAGGGAAGAAGNPGAAFGARMMGGVDQLDLLNRMLQNPAAMRQNLGVSDDQIAKLQQLIADIDAKIRVLDETIQKLGLEQANIFVKSLSDKEGKAEEELTALTEKIGKANTERAQLRVKRLLVLKEVLTPEQVEKAAELIKQNAARQEAINKAFEDGDMATVQRLVQEQQQQFGNNFRGAGGNPPAGGNPGAGFQRNPGGANPGGGNAPGGNRGNNPGGGNAPGGNRGNNPGGNNAPGGNRGNNRAGGNNAAGGNNNNNAGGNNAPAPQGWN